MPLSRVKLAGQDGRGRLVSVFDDFEEVAPLRCGKGLKGEVVEDEDLRFGESSKQVRVG